MVKKGKWSLLVTVFILLFGVFSTVLFYEVPLFSKNGNLWNSVAVVVSLLFFCCCTYSSTDDVLLNRFCESDYFNGRECI